MKGLTKDSKLTYCLLSVQGRDACIEKSSRLHSKECRSKQDVDVKKVLIQQEKKYFGAAFSLTASSRTFKSGNFKHLTMYVRHKRQMRNFKISTFQDDCI